MSHTVTHNLSKPELECIEYCTALETIPFNEVNFISTSETTVNDSTNELESTTITTTTSNPSLYYYNGPIKVIVPKLMPQYSVENPTEIYAESDTSILANNSSTYPSINGNVNVSNYIVATCKVPLTTRSGINYGETLTCIFPNRSLVDAPVIINL